MTLQTTKAMPAVEGCLEKAEQCHGCGELMVCQVTFKAFGSLYRLLQCPSCECRTILSDDKPAPVVLPEIRNYHDEDRRSVIRRPVEEAVFQRERRLPKRFRRQR